MVKQTTSRVLASGGCHQNVNPRIVYFSRETEYITFQHMDKNVKFSWNRKYVVTTYKNLGITAKCCLHIQPIHTLQKCRHNQTTILNTTMQTSERVIIHCRFSQKQTIVRWLFFGCFLRQHVQRQTKTRFTENMVLHRSRRQFAMILERHWLWKDYWALKDIVVRRFFMVARTLYKPIHRTNIRTCFIRREST